ncbi:hypothetical protein CYMTET_35077 [Cymbomonas tetramitiformis]|uniref:Uncharacterized protein n=1 Tax=Cymbomonas tetramitiformis TaxID=36881 RepID=A0AAE0KPJ9_9CHLO|nr:hypothetical protein CYMTET_35077 [Cymbomonas tetramitiformis]
MLAGLDLVFKQDPGSAETVEEVQGYYRFYGQTICTLILIVDIYFIAVAPTILHMLLLANTICCMWCALSVADVQYIRMCNRDPGSFMMAFMLIVFLALRFFFLIPEFIIVCVDSCESQDWIFWGQTCNTFLSILNIYLFWLGWKRLRELSPSKYDEWEEETFHDMKLQFDHHMEGLGSISTMLKFKHADELGALKERDDRAVPQYGTGEGAPTVQWDTTGQFKIYKVDDAADRDTL